MPRFDFAGDTKTIFPDVLTAAGSLVCRPGDTGIELDNDPHSPLLVPAAAPDKAPPAPARPATPPKGTDTVTAPTTEA